MSHKFVATLCCLAGLVLPSALSGPPLHASTGQLELTVVDHDTGKPIPCRMHLLGQNQKPRKPDKVPFWHDHFAMPGKMLLKLPIGNYTFVIERGLEYLPLSGYFTINHFADDTKQVELRRFVNMSADGWWSGDLDVRRPVRDIELLMAADDLHVAEVITWRNDKAVASAPLPKDRVVRFDGDRYYDVLAGVYARPGTELLLLGLSQPLALPPSKAEYPPLVQPLLARREKDELLVAASRPYWWDLPLLVAAGQIDSVEVAHGNICRDSMITTEGGGKPRDRARYPDPLGNALSGQEIYYQLLECGLRIPPTAGSGSGESPNPIGYNRVYVHLDGPMSYETWWQELRAGRVVVTNGPVLKPSVEGELPGHVFHTEPGKPLELEIGLTLSTRDPISYLEIVKNGHVEQSIPFEQYSKSGRLPKVRFEGTGWFLLRAVNDVPKTYRFAMTGPYYVESGYERRISKQAVRFFLDWVIERAKRVKLTDPEQQNEVLKYHRQAQDFWEDLLKKANAE